MLLANAVTLVGLFSSQIRTDFAVGERVCFRDES
jgi:hypothetical protein